MKKLFTLVAVVLFAITASAQKSEIAKARAAFDLSSKVETYKEDGVEKQRTVIVPEKLEETKVLLAKAKEAWDAAKADPKKAAKIKKEVIAQGYDLKGDLYQRYMAQELNHAVDKEPLDTMLFYNSLTECLDAYEECFRVDEKGVYTPKNLKNFMSFRAYYMYAGQFFSNNGQYVKSSESFGKWLDYSKRYTITNGDDEIGNMGNSHFDRPMVAYYAALTLYQGKAYEGMAKFEEEAMQYDKEADMVRQVYLAAAQEMGDTARWEALSHKFALEGTGGSGVVQNLLAHYFRKGDTEKVVAFAKELEAALPDNKMGPYAQGVVLVNSSKYDEAVVYFEKTLQIDPEYVDALLQAGMCWYNMGLELSEKNSTKKYKTKAEANAADEAARDLVRKAEPYFLKVQELQPDQPELWARRLSNLYYALGNTDKYKEYEAFAND